MPEDQEARQISRRTVLTTAALVPVAAIAAAASPATPVFSAPERRILEAFVERLIPRDENGPGASGCGVPDYIERALAGPIAAEKASLLEGLSAVDVVARNTHDKPFAELAPEHQDAVLTAVENNTAAGFRPDSRTFFNHIRRLTLEGMFSDPFYGGNKNFGGWDLIRYPGPRLAVSPEEQKIRVAIKPVRTSARGAGHGH
jgi:gluconate 2-dehydrogenase gamma chain